jgi:hypothetical protein
VLLWIMFAPVNPAIDTAFLKGQLRLLISPKTNTGRIMASYPSCKAYWAFLQRFQRGPWQ